MALGSLGDDKTESESYSHPIWLMRAFVQETRAVGVFTRSTTGVSAALSRLPRNPNLGVERTVFYFVCVGGLGCSFVPAATSRIGLVGSSRARSYQRSTRRARSVFH
jgi:hypothetical protein